MRVGFNHGDEIRLCIDGRTMIPRGVMREVGPDSTCDIRDHSRHRTAIDPIIPKPSILSKSKLRKAHNRERRFSEFSHSTHFFSNSHKCRNNIRKVDFSDSKIFFSKKNFFLSTSVKVLLDKYRA